MNTRTRVTAIPTLLAAGAFASLPSMLTTVAAQHAHGDATPAASQWGALGLPTLDLNYTTEAIDGMPESIEAGRYLVTVHGEPTEEDWGFGTLFVRLPDGLTFDAAMAEAGANPDAPPAFYYESVLAGGPVLLAATGASSATGIVDLPPGEWFVAGSALSQPPVQFTVTGELPADLPEPKSNVTFTTSEMAIDQTAGKLVVGENLIRVDNAGEQPHFIEFQKVPDGATLENIEATLQMEMGGTPESEPLDFANITVVGVSNDQSTGTSTWVTMQLEAGTYTALCFVADRETGMPHAYMGMYTVFTVE